MSASAHKRTQRWRGLAAGLVLVVLPGAAWADDDWDLYMLRLINRARSNPSAEAALIGSTVTDNRAPVPPLAYHEQIGQAAGNHNTWMHLNFGTIASGGVPDSFSHYETLNGAMNGTPATGTPSYTGVSLGPRITATGFSWSNAGENIAARWSSATIPVDQARIDAAHKGWWESSSHRSNMLTGTYTVFGHRAESRTFTPPRGGLSAPFDNLHFATQVYARPSGSPATHVFGVLFDDRDGSGSWTPRDLTHPQHEGYAGVDFDVYVAGTLTRVAGGTTRPSGGFSVRLGAGTYDLDFLLPGGTVVVAGITVAGANVNAGDITSTGVIGGDEREQFVLCLGGPGELPNPPGGGLTTQDCLAQFDDDGDGDVDLRDHAAFMRTF